MDQWNRIEDPEMNQHTYGHLIVDKGAGSIQWKKIVFSTNGAGSIGGQHAEECKLIRSYLLVLMFFNKHFYACNWGIDAQNEDFLLVSFPFDEYEMSYSISFDYFRLKVYFIRYFKCYSSLFLFPVGL